jgi:hypothetical protein
MGFKGFKGILVDRVFNLGRIHGAGDRDRTGDIQLGKLAFYR